MAMDFLKNLSSRAVRPAGGGGNYINQGKGVLIINLLKYDEQAEAGPTAIAEFVVDSSESIPGAVYAGHQPRAGQPELANAPGTDVSWVQQLQVFKSAAGNVKAFFLSAGGDEAPANEKEELEFEAGMRAAFSPTQPLKGMAIGYSTYQKAVVQGPNKGNMNTYVKFHHIPDQTPELIKERRAKLESK